VVPGAFSTNLYVTIMILITYIELHGEITERPRDKLLISFIFLFSILLSPEKVFVKFASPGHAVINKIDDP
jgi:hypothetical protein